MANNKWALKCGIVAFLAWMIALSSAVGRGKPEHGDGQLLDEMDAIFMEPLMLPLSVELMPDAEMVKAGKELAAARNGSKVASHGSKVRKVKDDQGRNKAGPNQPRRLDKGNKGKKSSSGKKNGSARRKNQERDMLTQGSTGHDYSDHEDNVDDVAAANVVVKVNGTKVKKQGGLRSSSDRELRFLLSGAARIPAKIGNSNDFPTDIMEEKLVKLTVDMLNKDEVAKAIKFRSTASSKAKKLRSLEEKVLRWEHKEDADDQVPQGCGFPVCVLVDMKPKRFLSMCHVVKWMMDQGHTRRIFMAQKGSCEDVIENVGADRKWVTKMPATSRCKKEQAFACNEAVCVNDNGLAKSFKSIVKAMTYLAEANRDVQTVAIGLGDCANLYRGQIFTEWFDLDDPSDLGDEESIISSHHFLTTLTSIDKKNKETQLGTHRTCSPSRTVYPLEFLAISNVPVQQIKPEVSIKVSKSGVACFNEENSDRKLAPPFIHPDKAVHCIDLKIRYACKEMWGTVVLAKDQMSEEDQKKFLVSETDVIVDPPQKKLFEGCEWRNFISYGYGGQEDNEMRSFHNEFMNKSSCGATRENNLYIDARTRDDDTPWDETGDLIYKNTPFHGMFCSGFNQGRKPCKDYKVRYCCVPRRDAQWSEWSGWSQCSKTCGGGTQGRRRVCQNKMGDNACFGITLEHYRAQTRDCNLLRCPQDATWLEWGPWTTCSATCDEGLQTRRRSCLPAKQGGKECPSEDKAPLLYQEKRKCSEKKCSRLGWGEWSEWSKCSVSCGSVGHKSSTRLCIDMAYNMTTVEEAKCLQELGGLANKEDQCGGHPCAVNGGFGPWQSWSACNVECGTLGRMTRRRYCVNPFPSSDGKDCEGDDEEIAPCKDMPPCPVHCLLSDWGEWSPCSISCGSSGSSGTRDRNRHVVIQAEHGGLNCTKGDLAQKDHCVHCEKCPDCQAGEEVRNCIPHCPVDCVWSEWGPYTGCGSCYKAKDRDKVRLRQKQRSRFVTAYPEHAGRTCDSNRTNSTSSSGGSSNADPDGGFENSIEVCKPDVDVPVCPIKDEPYVGAWSEWTKCEAKERCKSSSMIGTRERFRDCLVGNGRADSKVCEKAKFKLAELEECRVHCPDFPSWSPWNEWTVCRQTCGVGKVTRYRVCNEPEDKKDKVCQSGKREVEQRNCDMGPCQDPQDNTPPPQVGEAAGNKAPIRHQTVRTYFR